jgi:hypothetical protein
MSVALVDPIFCEHCLADNELKHEIQKRGTVVERCPICHHENGRAISATDSKIKRIFRALIRLNFSEWDYNEHIGGEDLETVVMRSPAIFRLTVDAAIAAFEDAYLEMVGDDWYPINDDEISLGGGYWNGCVLDGVRDRRDPKVERVLGAALENNWFETESAAREMIERFRNDLTATVPAGSLFFRGRIGVKSRLFAKRASFDEGRTFRYLPFSGKDIDRPPLKLATEGRFNRARVSLLYLASDVQTAVAF